mmetsp:Transcript_25192/g.40862  ORF Transcript_25192/g.40862 Transcript_25192/m.40862 type:complete len:678 (-) Transcript_25192:58-2091(-)
MMEAYGFDPDPSFTARHNAMIQLGNLPLWSYRSKATNLAFHDLTKYRSLPPTTSCLLGLGSKFIPTPLKTTSKKDMEQNISRFYRDICLAAHFAHSWSVEDKPQKLPSKLRVASNWQPPAPNQELYSRTMSFMRAVENALRGRTAMPNLLPQQQALLSSFQTSTEYVFPHADKGLGLCGILYESYCQDALRNHLLVEKDYRRLSKEEAWSLANAAHKSIMDWLHSYRRLLSDDAYSYIYKKTNDNLESPFGFFYTMYKLHKQKDKDGNYPTRPVCSDCASITHALGKWVDEQLQPIFRSQRTYFKNSYELKLLLSKMRLTGRRYSFFKYDAVAMYVNINTDACLDELSKYLRDANTRAKFPHYDPDMLLEAIELVMRNNIMTFGDLFFLQLSGVAMGISPAPPIASIFYAIFENIMLPNWTHCILFVRRFIDDGFAIWIHDPDPTVDDENWKLFQKEVNSFHGLSWDFDPRTQSMDYMDMTVTIEEDGRITTSLYEKEMNLYQYLPPNSCHPPGVLTGLIMGGVLRILQLCSDRNDADGHIFNFYHRLISRGHQPTNLLPIFDKAITNAEAYIANYSTSTKSSKSVARKKRDSIYFHIPYHPEDPRAKHWQELWQKHMVQPMGKSPLTSIDCGTATFPTDKLTVCYSRHLNLGNFLSYRKLDKFKGRAVSTFLPSKA